MAKGSIIAVVVSKGPSVRELPAIKNLSLSDASVAVTEAGFIPRKSEEAFSDEVPAGSVIGYKRYEEGDMMEYGTIIEIVVSKGPDPPADVYKRQGGNNRPAVGQRALLLFLS